MKKFSIVLALCLVLLVAACGGNKENTNENPDKDSTEADSDVSEPTDSDESGEPADTDEPENSDQDQEGPDSDSGTPADPEVAEDHIISGRYQIGSSVSGIHAALVECGESEEIAAAETDSDGNFSFSASITAAKTYCVTANGFASCFKGAGDHVANISEITNAVYLLDKNCEDLRKSETKIRSYVKLGTGGWLGELDYSKLSGVSEGLKLLSSLLGTNDAKTLSEKIAEDAAAEAPEFEKNFNGFRISVDRPEIVIGESADSNALFSVEGGSTKIAGGFKIKWTLRNSSSEAATYKFTTSTPGEYVARAQLVSDGGDPVMLSQDSETVLFLLRKNGGTVYLNDTSKHISFRIDDGIYGVIPKGTIVKKDGNKVNSISYDVLSAGGGKVSRLKFRPEGTVFEGDSMYFVHELGTVFGGDPIMLSATRMSADGTTDVMLSAGGDPVTLEALGDPIMFTAQGDPIMQVVRSALGDPIMDNALGDPIMDNALGDPIMANSLGDPIMGAAMGDPIMGSALGDPIMGAAMGDPIMMGTSSSAMISQTNHYSTFTVEAASLPVSVNALVSRWCDGSFYQGYSPIEFIRKGVEKYKPAGDEKTRLLSYLTCEKFGDLGNDLYELVNKPVGFQRNLNLFENLFFVSEFYNRMKARQEGGSFAAVRNGLELRSAIAALYTATTSYNRSATLADILDPSMIPLTYSGNAPKDYTTGAKSALTGNAVSGDIYAAAKKDMMIFANYITTSSKGPDFSNVSSVLTPDQLVCAWFNPDTPAQNCNKVYTLNENGHVTLGGTEIQAAEANAIFSKFFMPMNTRLSDSEKLDLFRTFYLALKYAGTVFYRGSDVEALHDSLLETAYLVFDGIDSNANAVTITDTFDASAHTVAVLDGAEMALRPYITKLSALTGRISLKVAAASADVEKVLISIEGREFEKVQENTRTYYIQTGELKEKTIVLTPGTLSQGEKALKTLLGSENIDSLGNITGKMTILVNSKIAGKSYTTQRSYDFFANDDSDGVNSKPVPANIQVFVNDSTGHAIPADANPTVILNPGSRVFYPADGVVSIENITPAAYTVDAFADGYYAKSVSVNVPAGAAFGVEVRLDEEITSSADANLALSVNIETIKHPSKVYIQIYNDDMDLVANEAAKFIDEENTYETLNVALNSGRYTLLAVGEEMYSYLEAITLYEGDNEKTITVVAKNACGNGIVDSAEECEPSVEGSTLEVICGDIYPASTHPEKKASCDPATCTFNKSECGKAALCGDGIIDRPSEACDGGSKECSEIAGFGNSSGSAPCRSDCSGYITANNCSKTTESCGTLPANAVWNDGSGRFSQTYNGSDWLPAAKAAEYGNTKEECVFSCAKGYRWNGTVCDQHPLSLGSICTGAESCFDNTEETLCPAYGTSLFGQDAQYAEAKYCTPHTLAPAGSGIIKDAYTHYEWQAASSSSAMNWTAADKYCSDLNKESGSSAMWRLPSPAELLTIVDSSTASPALVSIFTTYGHTFWASEDAKHSGNAWEIDENGALESVAKTKTGSVLCVRVRDYDAPANRFTAAAETVRDSVSGLMWQKQAVASRTWAEALNYCEEISTADKFDWRLPNRNELASLINYEKANGAASDFPAIAAKGFWTSTSSVAGNEAWTVDFESGKIEASEKTNTKYIICVRNDEPCFGGECADPCSFDACKGMANSTGLCNAGDYSFTCGCKSGFNWNHGKCLLDTTRYIACEGLPENASWNTVFGISQTYDGEKWYPSEVGTFDKTKSSTECHFICNANYDWDPDGGKCVAQTKLSECTGKPAKSVWNTVDRITQSWNGDAWEPSGTAVFSEEECTDECCFKCKEHFHWNSENNICVAATQEVECTGLPADGTAQWWKDPNSDSCTVIQTWNDDYSDWYPTASATYRSDGSAGENGCFFKCKTNYKWNQSYLKCEPQTNYNVACKNSTLPANAEWNQFSTVNQTWNGSAWIPSINGTYNETPSPDECRFKCKTNYTWNTNTKKCVANTRQESCTGRLANTSWWNNVSVITQTWNGSEWLPAAVGTYSDIAVNNECRFKCDDNYTWNPFAEKCAADSNDSVACEYLPEHASWWNSTVTQIWNGYEWTPTTVGSYSDDNSSEGCFFHCNNRYSWNTTYRRCDPEKQKVSCGMPPANAKWNVYDEITQTWNGNGWIPSTTGTYNETPSTDECRFKCNDNYTWNGTICAANTRQATCVKNAPHTSWWNDVSIITQTWNGATQEWLPTTAGTYSSRAVDNECRFKCNENYTWNNTECAADTNLNVACNNDTLPENAVWWNNTTTQTWNGSEWLPSTLGSYKEDAPAAEGCFFKCENENYKWNQAYRSCDPVTKYNEPCDNSTLPANAEWNVFATVNQTWNGTEYWPPKTGVYDETPSSEQCRYKCKNEYFWNESTSKCVTPCDDDPCYENSTGRCTAYAWNEYSCECKDGYFWSWGDLRCKKPMRLGNICTGQKNCYNDSGEYTDCFDSTNPLFGQDAYYTALGFCIPKSFTVKTTSGKNIVFDNNTNLEWQQDIPNTTYSWYDAADYCNTLKYGGYDWRLPTVQELQTLVDIDKFNPPIDTGYFPTTGEFWTSETFVESDLRAWYVNFAYEYEDDYDYSSGEPAYDLKESERYVRCVRGDKLPEALETDFETTTVEGDEIVTDKTTGLVWQKTFAQGVYALGTYSMIQALEYCRDLEYAGFNDWRLPNRNELASLLDFNVSEPSSNFPGEMIPVLYSAYPIYDFWTSSLDSNSKMDDFFGYTLLFTNGAGDVIRGGNPNYGSSVSFRCVRSKTCDNGNGIWNGSDCVNPCEDAGYFWNGNACINPCSSNPCAAIPTSTHECTPISWNKYSCGCNDGYFWSIEQAKCIPAVFGRVCTGQKRCYNETDPMRICPSEGEDFFGQDPQYAAMGFCAPKKFEIENVSGDNIVVDKNLGLEWQQSFPMEAYSRDDALDYCENLEYGGKTDWRLPTPKELISIADYDGTKDNEYFPGGRFWTSKFTGFFDAFVVDLYRRSVEERSGGWDTYVICVRGGELPEPVFVSWTVGKDKVVTDTTTGLVWQYADTSASYYSKENLAYCENLDYAGKGDWRLPNIYEMSSILNYDLQQPYSDFPGISSDIVYTSSSSNHSEDTVGYKRYAVSSNGKITFLQSSSNRMFKCVRSDCGEGKFWDGTSCVTPCASNPCGSVSHSNGSCKKSGSNGYECGCNTDEGYFWNGSSCVNPCDADPCNSKAHSVCTPYSWNVSVCSCDNESDGYFWNGSSCVNPCNSNPCASIAHARAYECSATGFNNYSCGCDAGYSWADGKCLPNCASGSATPCFDPSSGLIWSAKALNTMNLSDAIDYCDSYSEGGFGDWHLPNINELRTLVINCSKIEPGGICLAHDSDCLFPQCGNYNDMECACRRDGLNLDRSKLGDTEAFWSSSLVINISGERAWNVYFSYNNKYDAMVDFDRSSETFNVRCVR